MTRKGSQVRVLYGTVPLSARPTATWWSLNRWRKVKQVNYALSAMRRGDQTCCHRLPLLRLRI
jgi:hypothetical protein